MDERTVAAAAVIAAQTSIDTAVKALFAAKETHLAAQMATTLSAVERVLAEIRGETADD